MKTYRFKAVTAHGDRIIGLCFPAALVLPILATVLVLHYSGLLGLLKMYRMYWVCWLLFLPGLYMSYLLAGKIRKSVTKDFFIQLDKLDISIRANGNEVMHDEVLSCEIKAAHDKLARVDIYTETDEISFRARPYQYKTITGHLSFNIFGTSSLSDMEKLLEMGEAVMRNMERMCSACES